MDHAQSTTEIIIKITWYNYLEPIDYVWSNKKGVTWILTARFIYKRMITTSTDKVKETTLEATP